MKSLRALQEPLIHRLTWRTSQKPRIRFCSYFFLPVNGCWWRSQDSPPSHSSFSRSGLRSVLTTKICCRVCKICCFVLYVLTTRDMGFRVSCNSDIVAMAPTRGEEGDAASCGRWRGLPVALSCFRQTVAAPLASRTFADAGAALSLSKQCGCAVCCVK